MKGRARGSLCLLRRAETEDDVNFKSQYWFRAIDAAEERERAGKVAFTKANKIKAGDWVTCACGTLEDHVPRRVVDGEVSGPKDLVLSTLGVRFCEAVEEDDAKRAKHILRFIDERSSALKLKADAAKAMRTTSNVHRLLK